MAQRVHVLLVDDVDGTEAAETVSFGLDGVAYEIDLSGANAEQLRKGLAKWIESARRLPATRGAKAGRSTARAGGRPRAVVNTDIAKIRAWARGQNMEISDRGRIPAPIQEAYYAAIRES
ncbi:MAG: Lsr2 family protein [Bifidobacteriaceae bacterium]|jgi:hypothetical protein|nr:Lsr2 family protein [Bifidobacteriaceae bacterium]